jgi:hypothetical protein
MKRKGEKLPFWREKNENFVYLQSILFDPFENLNRGPSDLFPSDVYGASERQVPHPVL